jgi:hypothetical protein
MKAQAIKRYKCICEECEPLPPIDGLRAPDPAPEPSGSSAKGMLGKLAVRLIRSKGEDSA